MYDLRISTRTLVSIAILVSVVSAAIKFDNYPKAIPASLVPRYEATGYSAVSTKIEAVDEVPASGYRLVTKLLAIVCSIWYAVVVSLASLGTVTIWRKNTVIGYYPRAHGGDEGVTILRPLKGIDTDMEQCLMSAFLQDYSKFEIIFCVESAADPAVSVANDIMSRFEGRVDARLMVSEPEDIAQGIKDGPNPKINNLAKGYRAAKYDIVWVLDSNVWTSPGTLSRSMVEFSRSRTVQLVHHLPMCLSTLPGWEQNAGGKLDEMFMLTAHAKFYTAINTVGLAPCVMGKSNMYRRSDLDRATNRPHGEGIRAFAPYIAEDNMIAECLWRHGGRTAMTTDTVIQPLASVSFDGYMSRRIRWLRVRRYMVLAATLLEPTTESIVCGIIGSFGYSVSIFSGYSKFNFWFFFIHMALWCLCDYFQFHNLIGFTNVEHLHSPFFVTKFYSPDHDKGTRREFFKSWLPTWFLREILAMPIWIAAMSGHKIKWRNKPFRIKPDLTAEELSQ